MHRNLLGLTASFFAVVATPAAAQANVGGFDIAGVKLGMPRGQVSAATKAAGYTQRPSNKFASELIYSDQVNQARTTLDSTFRSPPEKPRQPIYDAFSGTSGQRLTVYYVQTAQGPVVSGVTFNVAPQVIAFSDVERASVAKYGKPSAASDDYGRHVLWCEKSCNAGNLQPSGFKSVTLAGGRMADVELTLSDGGVTKEQARRSVMEEAARLSGKGAKPSF